MNKMPKTVWQLLKETYQEWSDDQAPRLGAALAYYTIFSLAPLLLIVVALVGTVWGNQSGGVQTRLLDEIAGLVGPGGAEVVSSVLEGMEQPGAGSTLATVFGVAALLFGATGVFAHLQWALNWIWDVAPDPERGILNFLMARVLSFGMILGIGFLLLVSLLVSAGLSALGAFLAELAPNLPLLQALNQLISFGVVTLLFAMIYRYLPDAEIAWRDVGIGAAITALLFTLGKYGLGAYLGTTSVASAYGAAGSLVVLLVWVYYSAQIFFFGAEFTQVYARRYGTRIRPAPYAMRVSVERHTEEELAAAEQAEQAPELQASAPARTLRRPSRLRRYAMLAIAFLAGRFFGHRSS